MARTQRSIDGKKKEWIEYYKNKNFSYSKIKDALHKNHNIKTSKSNISFHCGEDQKLKSFERHRKQTEGIQRKVHSFIYPKRKKTAEVKPATRTDIRKKMRGFVYAKKGKRAFRDTHLEVKPPVNRIWATLGMIWPGITVKNRNFQAVNQWTKQLDFEDGKSIMFPFVRCRLSGEIIDAELSNSSVDHIDGNRNNNRLDNFSFVSDKYNRMKSNFNHELLYKMCEKFIKIYRKYYETTNNYFK